MQALIFDCLDVLITGVQATKNTDLLVYIQDLKRQGYKVGILSNLHGPWVRQAVLNDTEQALFDDMLFSHEVGMDKTDPAIYLLACQRLEVAPDQAVFIDNSDVYCQIARSQGLHALVYHDLGRLKSDLKPLLAK